MKKLLLLTIVFLSACVPTDDNSISSSPNGLNENSENPSGPGATPSEDNTSDDPNTTVTSSKYSNEILIDFSNTTDLTDHFTASTYSGFSFSQTGNHPYTGTNSAKCTSDADRGSCTQTSINTFNLPISIEVDMAAVGTHFTGTFFRISLYEGTPTRESNYNMITSATNLSQITWLHSYTSDVSYAGKFIIGGGSMTDALLPLVSSGVFSLDESKHNVLLSDYGKIKLEIDTDGSYTTIYTEYDSNGDYLNEHIDTGILTDIPSNFTIELQQRNYSSNKIIYYDNLKISY